MNIICDKSKLLEGINISLKAIPGKSTMAILECMVIEAKDGMIKLISNDLEIGIETIIEGDIKEPGSVAVNAKVFFEIIRKLPYNEVSISVNENLTMNISCGKAKFNIPVKDTEEFPYLPKIVKDKSVLISQFTLKEVIRQTVFSISDNENTKVMTGELFEIKNNYLKIVSLDGHRIAIRRMELKKDYTIVMVTHNMQQAARISDKTAFFLLGEVVEYGETEQIFSMPKDKRTEDYITGRFG